MRAQSLLLLLLLSVVERASAQSWVQTSAPWNSWTAVAASADATRLVAVAGDSFGSGPSGIWLSTNSGGAWMLTSAPSNVWTAVASSANGARLIAAAGRTTSGNENGPLYTSNDGGQNWLSNCIAPKLWKSVACSADGSRLFAETVFGELFISTNGGALWTSNAAPGGAWVVTCSPDGRIVLTGGGNASTAACVSTNGGLTWSTNQLSSWRPRAVAMSANGRWMRAGNGAGDPAGLIYSSTNFGATWASTNSPRGIWVGLASSADGSKLAAIAHRHSAQQFGPLYTSMDSGLTWVSNSLPEKYWRGVACSGDGSTLIAVADRDASNPPDSGDGTIWMLKTTPQPRLNIAPSGGGLRFSWVTSTTNFGLQQRSLVNTGAWTSLTNVAALNLTNLQREIFLPLPASNTFYRLNSR